MDTSFVKSTIKNHVLVIEFFHPQSNSLPGELLNKLADEITQGGENEDAKCILLRSSGDRAFCAGASFDELVAIETPEAGLTFFSGFAKVINAVRTCPKFVIGRVQGKAVGGGVGVASAMDYCFATKHAGIKLSELAIGIGPFVVGPAVERKMGKAAFTELAIDASEWRSAEWACQHGLYSRTYDSIEEMDNEIENFLNRMTTYSPEAMQELKSIFWQGTEHWDKLLVDRAKISGRLVLSDFTRKAINNFKSKS